MNNEKITLKVYNTPYYQTIELSGNRRFIRIILNRIDNCECVDIEEEMFTMSFDENILDIYKKIEEKVINDSKVEIKKGYIKSAIKYEEVIEEHLIVANKKLTSLKVKRVIDGITYKIEKQQDEYAVTFLNLKDTDLEKDIMVKDAVNDVKRLIKTI